MGWWEYTWRWALVLFLSALLLGAAAVFVFVAGTFLETQINQKHWWTVALAAGAIVSCCIAIDVYNGHYFGSLRKRMRRRLRVAIEWDGRDH